MEKVYDLHQHTHCVIMQIGKNDTTTHIFSTSNKDFITLSINSVKLDTSIFYDMQRTDVSRLRRKYRKEGDDIIIDNFRDGLYNLFKKDKKTWDEDDKFLIKAVSDYLPLAVKNCMKKKELRIENFDLFHYVLVVPSEWEEGMRNDMMRPIFVQSGLISKEDHQDRLLFFTDIESICYYEHPFQRGQNTILCRLTPDEKKIIIKFDLIQATTTLFNVPNAKLFPKVIKSISVSITTNDIQDRIKEFLRKNLFPVATTDDGSAKELQVTSSQNQIIKAIAKRIDNKALPSLDKENEEKDPKKKPWITVIKKWILNESQKEFITSLCPSIICAEIGIFLLDYMRSIVSNNFTKSYRFLIFDDSYSSSTYGFENNITWLRYILKYNSCSLNSIVKIATIDPRKEIISSDLIIKGVGIGIFEAIQHSYLCCKPRIVPSIDLTNSSSVFLNSKLTAIINLDISLESTLCTFSLLDEFEIIQQIFNHDYFIKDKHLPSLGHFFTFSNMTTLTVKEQFIPFAERYLLGDSVKKDLLLEMKAILTNDLSDGEILVSTGEQKYIKAFILMYMIYINEEILYELLGRLLIPEEMEMKIGYAVSIEAMLLNNTLENKDNLRDIIYASGLVPKDDQSKKLRIITQGERILPAIQKSLKLELSLKSYFLLCQLHEDYVQLSLHQVVTSPNPEEKEQESIIVQDEIIAIQNIYDSLCSYMWCNLQQDSSLLELCQMHNTSDNNKILDLLSSEIKTEFFDNLKSHISDNVLQSRYDTRRTYAVKLTSSCNCKVRLTASDMIDISFTPFLQNIACTLSASLLNKEFFGNYMNIDYLFSFIHFNNNPQLQYAFARILEEEANEFNLEAGIDTSCLLVPELFSQLIQPIISERPFCYKDFRTGALQQVCSENYVFCITHNESVRDGLICKSEITDTKPIECDYDIAFPFLNKGETINNVRLSRKFYLQNESFIYFRQFNIEVYKFETMNYLENNETLFLNDNIYQRIGDAQITFDGLFESENVDVPVIIFVSYLSYTSTLQFSVKLIGVDARDKYLTSVLETGEPLTLTRF